MALAGNLQRDYWDMAQELLLLRNAIEARPDDHEWTKKDLDDIETLRDACHGLAREIEAVFDTLRARGDI